MNKKVDDHNDAKIYKYKCSGPIERRSYNMTRAKLAEPIRDCQDVPNSQWLFGNVVVKYGSAGVESGNGVDFFQLTRPSRTICLISATVEVTALSPF